jgi:hypothetical protein
MKPDWKDAPEWAQYLAMDESGSWWWFEYEPMQAKRIWGMGAGFRCERAVAHVDWKNTLEKRPESAA